MTTSVDGVAAAATLLSWRTCDPGYCLHYVWQAYKAHGATCSETYPTAYSAWLGSGGKHEGDWNPPAGVPVYFGPRANSNAGDVVISTGGGMCNATDWPHNGVIGSCSLADRQRQIGRPYLGWCDNILNYPIALSRVPIPEPALPEWNEENMLVLVANAETPGQFAVWNERQGWVDLAFDDFGNAQLRGVQKMIAAASADGQTVYTADMSGQEWAATRDLLSAAPTTGPGRSHDPHGGGSSQ